MVATSQLRALGYSYRAIQSRAAAGRLHRIHRGVYAVGHTRITVRARWMAAVLACGPDAVLSHRAAAALWGLRAAPSGPIDATARSRHTIAGVRCHFARSLYPDDRATIDGIPVTSIGRTLLDLAEILSPQRFRSMLEAAQRRNLLDVALLEAQCERGNGRRGIRALRHALTELSDEAPWTQSELERRFLELIRAAGLPEPQVNVVVYGVVVDFYWPDHNLVAEVDGYKFHGTRRSFEDDRRKDAKLQIAGVRVVRFTYARVFHEPRALERDLRRLLALSPAAGPAPVTARSGR